MVGPAPSPPTWERALPWVVHGCLVAGGAWLLLGGRPPFVDLPQHALSLTMLRHPEVYGADHLVRLRPLDTNSLWFTLDSLVLAPLLSVTASVSLASWLALIGLPPAVAWWARAQGHHPGTALILGGAAAWSRPLFWGFFHYALSLPTGICALALDLELQRRGAGRGAWRGVLLALTLVVLFLLHAQTTAFVLGALGLQRGCAALLVPGRRRLLVDGLPWVAPGASLLGAWVVRSLWAPAAEEAPLGTLTAGLGASYVPIGKALGDLTLATQGFVRSTPLDDNLAGVLLALCVGGAAAATVRARRAGDREGLAVGLAGLGTAATALALYLAMPQHIEGQFYLSTRMAVWIVLATLPAACVHLPPPWHRARLALATLLALGLAGTSGWAIRTFAAEAAPLDGLLARLEPAPGRRLALWASDRTSTAIPGTPFTHHLAWYAAENFGTVTFSFASFRPNPVVYRDPEHTPHTRSGDEFRPWCTAFAGEARDVDVVVTRDPLDPAASCDALHHYRDNLHLVGREGAWALYRVDPPLAALAVECRCGGPE